MMINLHFFALTKKALTVLLVVSCGFALAQTPSTASLKTQLVLEGKTLDGGSFDLVKLKGKVVMVFYWSTRCSVCLSHMPELRANLAGWRGKPFELVTVNVDADMTDWIAYEKITTTVESVRPRAIWTGKASDQRLPLTLVLDMQGRVVARHEGRIAPEAWDSVAEILP